MFNNYFLSGLCFFYCLTFSLMGEFNFDDHESKHIEFFKKYQVMLDFLPTHKIYLNPKDKSGSDAPYTTVDELFSKNNVQLAILVFDPVTATYYAYDAQYKKYYEQQNGWLYFFIDENKKPMIIGLAYHAVSLFPYLEAISEDAEAQQQLAMLYIFPPEAHDFALPRNEKLGFEWLMKSALQGLPKAQFDLASAYFKGMGIPRDPSKGIVWLQKAAENNYCEAIRGLALCNDLGIGTEQNKQKAIELYKQSAHRIHDSDSEYELGAHYALGDGIEQNYDRAYEWYAKAANKNYSFMLATYYARVALALMHEEGLGSIEQSNEKAVYWYEKALDQNPKFTMPNLPAAANNLAICLLEGRGVDEDGERAFELLSAAVLVNLDMSKKKEQYLSSAMVNLGLVHEFELSGKGNPTSAFIWYQKAAKNENVDGLFHLGRCYFYGVGVSKKYVKAFEIFMQAAQMGHAQAAYFVGLCYEYGFGISKDIEAAQTWYRQAAQMGDLRAQAALSNSNSKSNNLNLLIKSEVNYQNYLAQKPSFVRERVWQFNSRFNP